MRKLVVEDQVESTLSLLDGSLQIHATRPTQRQNQQSAQSVTKSERYTGNDAHTHTQSVRCRCVCVHVCVYSHRYPIKGIFEAVLKHTETQSLVLSILLQVTERPVRRLIGRDSKAPHFICTMCVISNKFALLGNYWKAT